MPRRQQIPQVEQCSSTGNVDMGQRVEGQSHNPRVGICRWEPKTLRRYACYAEAEPYGMANLAVGMHVVNRGQDANQRNMVQRLQVHMKGVRLEYSDDRIIL